MSSKGMRVAGTDGSDFEHRETVAGRYKCSIIYKGKLKILIWAHIVLWMILLIKLGDEVLNRFDILIPDIAELAIPKPLAWEYVWVLSIIPSTLGLAALSRNRLHFLNVLYYGIPVFGILPIIGAGIYMFPEIVEYWATRKTKETLMGYPLVWMWYIFFALALQLHLFQVYFSHQLRKAWDKSAKSK